MKTQIISTIAALSLALTFGAQGEEGPMNAGLVQSVSKEKGTLTIRTEQSGGGPIVYYGMNKAEILTVGGKPATLADITQGQRVTVFYGKQGDHWVVSRVLLPEPGAATATTAASVSAGAATSASTSTSAAATDGDRTTKPSNNQAAATDGDRTTKPSNNQAAAADGDRTTVPGDKSQGGLHRR